MKKDFTNSNKKHNFLTASDFYKEKFGCKVYKISLDAGCTCPNRDGKLDTRGCIFCSAGGSGEFAEKIDSVRTDLGRLDSVHLDCSFFEQIEKAKKRVLAKNKNGKFIAYFQNFTNTYEAKENDFQRLSSLFLQAANAPDIVGIAIGTRPDCISERMIEFLTDLSKKTFVQLEFGLQTSNENTAKFIRRCYENSVYVKMMERLKIEAPHIHVVTHIIFGLPGETEKDMLETVRFAVKNKTDGIKITCLHVLKNTDLEKLYIEEKFKTLEMNEYFALIQKALQEIPENIVIHRLTGDGPKSLLLAPMWTANKKVVLNELNKLLNSF